MDILQDYKALQTKKKKRLKNNVEWTTIHESFWCLILLCFELLQVFVMIIEDVYCQ